MVALFGADRQSSFVAIMAWSDERTSVNVGLPSGFAMPKDASDGPRARTTRVFAVAPPTMKPPIITSLPVPTLPRVDKPSSGLVAGAVARDPYSTAYNPCE